MAKTSYILVPPGYEELLRKGLQPGDRFTYTRISRKNRWLSLPRKKRLALRTLLPAIAEIWNGLDLSEQELWNEAALGMGWSGWRLFTQDTAERMRLELPGLAIPDELHQSFVGLLYIADPGDNIKLNQAHPSCYWVRRKVRGTQDQYAMVKIKEVLTLPLTLTINYKAELSSVGSAPSATFYALIRSMYQGLDVYTRCEVSMSLSSGWVQATKTISGVMGRAISYSLYLELNDVRGSLWFDNPEAVHNGQNWVRDPFCRAIRSSFTKAYVLVPRHWSPVSLPIGADFDSVYVDN